jgi:hypothetical protein
MSNVIEVRSLPEVFTKPGYCYRLLKRTPKVAIYEQRHRSGGLAAYEVIIVRNRAERRIGNEIIPAGEYLPSDGEWGRFGWTFSGFGAFVAAEAKMDALMRQMA